MPIQTGKRKIAAITFDISNFSYNLCHELPSDGVYCCVDSKGRAKAYCQHPDSFASHNPYRNVVIRPRTVEITDAIKARVDEMLSEMEERREDAIRILKKEIE